MINDLAGRITYTWQNNWNAKLDIQYKFYGLERSPEGKWLKAHTFGLFLNYGKQPGNNINRMMSNKGIPEADSAAPAQNFYEAEAGFMLREEFRISGGGGVMHYRQFKDGLPSNVSLPYFCVTAGLSPRIFRFMELDFNVSGLLLNGAFRPRANVNAVILIRTGRGR